MHKTAHHRHLTSVHWPILRGWCRGSGTKGDLSTKTGSAHRGARRETEAVVLVTAEGLGTVIDTSLVCAPDKKYRGVRIMTTNVGRRGMDLRKQEKLQREPQENSSFGPRVKIAVFFDRPV